MPRRTQTCEQCEMDFIDPRSRQRRYCSVGCYRESRSTAGRAALVRRRLRSGATIASIAAELEITVERLNTWNSANGIRARDYRTIPRKPERLATRFWRHVRKTRGCWLWTAKGGSSRRNSHKAYGVLNTRSGEYLAHRISWTIHYGPIPKGLRVLHKCDVRRCVKPSHLFLGTAQDNSNDMMDKGRSIKGRRQLALKTRKTIYRLYRSGRYSQAELAETFAVDQTTISNYIREFS